MANEPKYANRANLERLYDNIKQREVQTFDTVAAMQAATYLEAGMTCHTNGFHASGDGGAAYYTISASGTANGMDVLALQGGLFATLTLDKTITPEMIGAPFFLPTELDGTDDARFDCTTYIQYLATNYDVVGFRFDLNHGYYVTDTITLTRAYQLFTGGDYFKSQYTDNAGSICFRPSSATSTAEVPLFNITRQQVHFYGMNIDAVQVGKVFYAKTSVADVDLVVTNCRVSTAGLVFDIWGRGCEVSGCHFSSCYDVAKFNWDQTTETQTFPEGTGQRRIYFKSCEFHSIRNVIVNVESGAAWGFQFVNNTVDHGRGTIIYTAQAVDGWVISGNVMQALSSTYAFRFMTTISNTIIDGNRFSATPGYWSSVPDTFIRTQSGGSKNVVISNNTFEGCLIAPIRVAGIDGLSVVGNVAKNCSNENAGCLLYLTSASFNQVTIIGNVNRDENHARSFIARGASSSIHAVLSNSAMFGNVTNAIADMLLATCELDSTCRYDFQAATA